MITYDDLVKATYLLLRYKEASIDDPLRPLYHLHAPANWMNDPHGAIHYKGKFHLFYQVNPYGKNPGYQSWGHFVSEDLVRWEHAPLALVPESGERDSWDLDGCWSGCCLLFDSGNGEGQKPTIFYTGAKYGSAHNDVYLEEQRQLTAVCIDDDLVRWQKNRDPVIEPSSHPDYRENYLPRILDCMRDPFVWQQEDRYYCLIGSAILKRRYPDKLRGGGNALIYQYDRGRWQLLSRRFCDIVLGRNWECCNLVRLDGKEILIVSPEYEKESGGDLAKEKRHVVWIPGSTKKDENGLVVPMGRDGEGSFYFKSDAKAQILDYGTYEGFYAATTFAHPDGRHIVWGWSTGGGEQDAEWNGVLSLPREISWKGYLSIAPLTEMERLRGERLYSRSHLDSGELANGERKGVYGDCVEIDAKVSIANYQELLVHLWSGRVTVSIEPEPSGGTLRITDAREPFKTKLDPKLDWSCVRLHLFLDRSIVEVFLDDKQVITRRVAPWLAPNTRKDREIAELLKNPRIEFRSRGGDISVRKLRIDKMNPIF